MSSLSASFEELKQNINDLLYSSHTVSMECANRLKVLHTIDVLESDIKDIDNQNMKELKEEN